MLVLVSRGLIGVPSVAFEPRPETSSLSMLQEGRRDPFSNPSLLFLHDILLKAVKLLRRLTVSSVESWETLAGGNAHVRFLFKTGELEGD